MRTGRSVEPLQVTEMGRLYILLQALHRYPHYKTIKKEENEKKKEGEEKSGRRKGEKGGRGKEDKDEDKVTGESPEKVSLMCEWGRRTVCIGGTGNST